MKTLLNRTFLVIASCILFCSCHHTDLKSKVIGEWEGIYEREVSRQGMITEHEYHNIITFNPNGTFTDRYDGGVVWEGTWSLEGRDFAIYYERVYEKGVLVKDANTFHGTGRLEKVTDTEMMLDLDVVADGYGGYLDTKMDFIRR